MSAKCLKKENSGLYHPSTTCATCSCPTSWAERSCSSTEKLMVQLGPANLEKHTRHQYKFLRVAGKCRPILNQKCKRENHSFSYIELFKSEGLRQLAIPIVGQIAAKARNDHKWDTLSFCNPRQKLNSVGWMMKSGEVYSQMTWRAQVPFIQCCVSIPKLQPYHGTFAIYIYMFFVILTRRQHLQSQNCLVLYI